MAVQFGFGKLLEPFQTDFVSTILRISDPGVAKCIDASWRQAVESMKIGEFSASQ